MREKYKAFIEFFDWLVENCKCPVELSEDVQDIYNLLLAQQEISKPMFTESGLAILKYLQSCDTASMKAKDIAEGMVISSRKVSGAIRKLVSDGFVDKYGSSPVIYSLTAKGKEFNIAEYKDNMN